MNSLQNALVNAMYINEVNNVCYDLTGQEILNESFKSSLLQSLAKAINTAEAKNAENDKREAERYKNGERSYLPSKSARSFASIFGPLTEPQRWGKSKTGIQGIKWSEIKDSDFKKFSTSDKELIKIMKAVYAKKQNADFICCKPDTNEVIYFIKGYGKEGSDVRLFGFNTEGWSQGVKEKTAKKYAYQTRSLKYNEAAAIIDGLDIYVLEITDAMKSEYKDLHTSRETSQEGVINYDENSLKELLKIQKARYSVLVKEIKAKKLQEDPNILFGEIEKTNQEVIDLYKKVISNPDNMDQRFDLGDLMRYVSYAYECFYKSMKYKADAERSVKRAKEKGASDEDAQQWGKFDREYSDNEIRDAKEYVQKIKKAIEDINSKLK